METGYKYTQKTCFSFCTQLMTTQKCGCNSKRTLFKVEGVEKDCSLSDELNCVEKVWNSFTDINTFCYPKCPFECARSQFDQNTNIVKGDPFEKKAYASLWTQFQYLSNSTIFTGLNRTNIPAYLVNHLTTVELNYDTTAFIQLTEEPKMTQEDLIGAIGGHLHLFLGLFFSFF